MTSSASNVSVLMHATVLGQAQSLTVTVTQAGRTVGAGPAAAEAAATRDS